MFCDACGNSLQPGQEFCSSCGKQVREGLSLAAPRPSRVREHVRLLGILWLAYSAMHVVGAIVLLIVGNTIFLALPGMPSHGPAFLQPLLTGIAIALLIKSAIGLAAGWGLIQREPWARILVLIVAFLSLFNVPLGTVLGIYTLWVLLPTQSDREYEAQARAA
jgi:hypothetical protein